MRRDDLMGSSKFPWGDIRPIKVASENTIDFRGSRGAFIALVEQTHSNRSAVATRLTQIVSEPGVTVTATDQWVPYGPPRYRDEAPVSLIAESDLSLIATEEVDLTRPNPFLRQPEWSALGEWWFAFQHIKATGPTWDLISTFGAESTNERPKGLLLFEGKAHVNELKLETCREHQRGVLEAMAANYPDIFASKTWQKEFPYQMANRFAFGLKLAELGYDVVLVYLGFLNAAPGRTYRHFASRADWESAVQQHASTPVGSNLLRPATWTADALRFASGGSFRARVTFS
jgi:hypothetical protein